MKRTSRTTGRLALLAAPLLIVALTLALSACGSSTPAGTSAPSASSVTGGTSTSGSTSTPSATTGPSGASTASDDSTAFCTIWRETRATLSEMNAVMGTGYSMSSPSSVLLPTMQAIDRVFGRLVQVAPAPVSGDMTTLAGWWDQVVGDFQYGSTLGQVKAYLDAHPPALTDKIDAATHGIDSYLSSTCHINVSS